MASLPPLHALLRDMVAIPSVNPTGDPGTPHVNEQKMAEFLLGWTERHGAEAALMPVLPDRPNLVARWRPKGLKPGQRPRHRIWFAPHTDTVSVAGMTVAPFDPVISKGRQPRLYGRGASDTKGPMAAMLHAIAAWWKAGGKNGDVEILFVGLMGEEAGNEGAKALVAHPIPAAERPDLVIVGEPTGLRVVTAHKGALWLTLTAAGKACHASTPERGRNAIDLMAPALVAIRKQLIPALRAEKYRHPLLGLPTLNIGTIRGGSKVNIVPDACVVEVDCRTTPALSHPAVLALAKRIVKAAAPGVRVEKLRGCPGLATDPAQPLITALRQASAAVTGGKPKPPGGVPWFCDAAIFDGAGLPAVAFGPGTIAQAHTRDEYIALRDLDAGAAALLRYLTDLL
ncbi:acetylornithine deacetylase/succinyl-diaminopimelate desuccinylase [Verrucomicrobium sp. GAS474]|uniref:M20 family metallopeptidase n=1 Tax=Verrucomicrobium sp. GAS474 TaxID=1882831 RepID=UPI00087C8CC8|nr:M20 family metallopeptidase [Verrucomicrobium sp. GAS474]SDT89390.1 acetylornithine deacetylase/succinyl-diaminopimelate desuccinylase [Verrucomicrobium sp. GAS474]